MKPMVSSYVPPGTAGASKISHEQVTALIKHCPSWFVKEYLAFIKEIRGMYVDIPTRLLAVFMKCGFYITQSQNGKYLIHAHPYRAARLQAAIEGRVVLYKFQETLKENNPESYASGSICTYPKLKHTVKKYLLIYEHARYILLDTDLTPIQNLISLTYPYRGTAVLGFLYHTKVGVFCRRRGRVRS